MKILVEENNSNLLTEAPGSLSGNRLKIFNELVDRGWDEEKAKYAVTDNDAYAKILKQKKDSGIDSLDKRSQDEKDKAAADKFFSRVSPENKKKVYSKLQRHGKTDDEIREIMNDPQKYQDALQELSGENDEIWGDNKSRDLHKNLIDIEKVFNKKPRAHWADAKNKLSSVYTNAGLKRAAGIIDKYEPEFIKNWANSFGWQSVGDKNEPFMQALNNPKATRILGAGDQENWVKLYNLLYDEDFSDYATKDNVLIYNPNLYKNVQDNNVRKKLVSIDMKTDNDNLRKKFNKALDDNDYNKILLYGDKKLGIKSGDNIADMSKKAVNTVKNMSSEERVKAMTAMNPTEKELQAVIQRVNNANNNKGK